MRKILQARNFPFVSKPSLETTRTNLAWERHWYFAASVWGLPL
jgi:hypothetical protein